MTETLKLMHEGFPTRLFPHAGDFSKLEESIEVKFHAEGRTGLKFSNRKKDGRSFLMVVMAEAHSPAAKLEEAWDTSSRVCAWCCPQSMAPR